MSQNLEHAQRFLRALVLGSAAMKGCVVFTMQQGLFLVTHLVDVFNTPIANLFGDVGIRSADLAEILLGCRRVALIGGPLRTLDAKNKTNSLHEADHTANSENNSPHRVMAKEVTKQLGEEDANIAHDLGESTKEPPLGRRCDLRDVDGYYHNGSAGTNAREKTT